MKILTWLFRSRSQPNFLEKQVLEAVALALPEKAAAILRAQMSLINKVQRLDHDREVDFYHIENGKVHFPKTALFPNQAEEFELARVKIKDIATGHQTEAAVFLVKGRLFSIEFSHTPSDLRGSSDLKIEVVQLNNPMHSGEPNPQGVP